MNTTVTAAIVGVNPYRRSFTILIGSVTTEKRDHERDDGLLFSDRTNAAA